MTNPGRIAVLIPCYNEEPTIATVVRDFRAALPTAAIHVFDNNPTDRSIEIARAAGALVQRVTDQGKGYVVRRMFTDIEADIYLLVDGDATYHAPSAPAMIAKLVDDRLDMVVGARVDNEVAAYRPGHRTGNRLLTSTVASMFSSRFTDMLFGFVTAPVFLRLETTDPFASISNPVAPYGSRPEGSASKLNTWQDGFRIMRIILKLYRSERPLRFFGLIGALSVIVSIAFAIPIVVTFLETGLVPRLPTAVLSMGLMLAGFLFFVAGLILDTVSRGRRETKLLAYLQHPAPRATST